MHNMRSILLMVTLPILTTGLLEAMEQAFHAPNQVLFSWAKKLKRDEIVQNFKRREAESIIKMALRIVYAQTYGENLDYLDCVFFVKNIDTWVNGINLFPKTTLLFSQQHLENILPLLEATIQARVVGLSLSGNNLYALPPSIGLLTNLKELYLENNNLSHLPNEICLLKKLRTLSIDPHVKIPNELLKQNIIINVNK